MNQMTPEIDEYWMQRALKLGKRAEAEGEVPIGAVVVIENQLIGEGWNQPIRSNDPSAHAEMVAIRQAAQQVGNYRLVGTTLYTTLQPCPMCAGLITHARIQRCVYGACDQKAGLPNHRVEMVSGVLEETCRHQLIQFFQCKR